MKRSIKCLMSMMVMVMLIFTSVVNVSAEVIGNDLIDRASTDGVSGAIFILEDPFTASGQVTDWGFFHQVPLPVLPLITPILYTANGGGYEITGIGTTRSVSGIGQHDFDFGLVSGSNAVGPGIFYGWKDGSVGTNNTGTVEWDGGAPMVYLGGGHTTPTVGTTYPTVLTLGRTYSIQMNTVDGGNAALENVGNPLTNRANLDGAVGAQFVMTSNAFLQAGLADSWSFFNDNVALPPPPPAKEVTPLIIENIAGSYVIRGIGATRVSSNDGAQNYSFDLVAGTDIVGPNMFLGWKDGGQGTNNNGTIEFDDGTGDSIRYFGGGHTNYAVAQNLGAGSVFPRTYSLQATTAEIAPPTPSTTIIHGQDTINRGALDSWYGHLAHATPITDAEHDLGQVVSWEIFNNNADTAGRMVTPLLLQEVSAGDFIVIGIGTSREVDESGLQEWDFDLLEGTDLVNLAAGDIHMGLRFGTPTNVGLSGVEFDAGGSSWFFYGDAVAVNVPNLTLGGSLGTACCGGNPLARSYSAQYNIQIIPEPSSMMVMLAVGMLGLARKRSATK